MRLLCTFTCNTYELLQLNLLENVNLEISDLWDGRTVYALAFVLTVWVESSLVWHTHRYPVAFRCNRQFSLYSCEQKGHLNGNLADLKMIVIYWVFSDTATYAILSCPHVNIFYVSNKRKNSERLSNLPAVIASRWRKQEFWTLLSNTLIFLLFQNRNYE